MVDDVLHEGVGHAALALVTGTHSGVLSTVAWSSAHDSRLVAAGGTVVNLLAGIAFWIALRSAGRAGIHVRLFLLFCCAFNLFAGTGYFFFSGVTNFGDWALVIAGIEPHWLWRTLLIVVGIASYYGAVLLAGTALVEYVGIRRTPHRRLVKVSVTGYVSAVVLAAVAALPNPAGIGLMWQSALPASAGANSALFWWQHYIPKGVRPQHDPEPIARSYGWIILAAALAAIFVAVLGRGITLTR